MQPRVASFHHAETGTWSHVVSDPGTGAAAIVDPVLDYDARAGRVATGFASMLAGHVAAQSLDVRWLLETHAHADHLSAAHWLKRRHFPDAAIAIGAGIGQVQSTFARVFGLGAGFPTDGSQFDHLFRDGETFAIGDLAARVIGVPGHTADGNAYLVGDALFPGDSLFMPDAGTARCDFPGGDAATLYRSIQRLYALPDDTRVFVCHDYGPNGRPVACQTTIGEQKRGNIHVRTGTDEDEFVRLRTERDATLPVPALLYPAMQANIRAGALPPPDANGVRYFKIPLDVPADTDET